MAAALNSRPEYEHAVVLDASYGVSASRLRDIVFLDTAQEGIYVSFLRRMAYFDIKVGAFAGNEGSGLKERTVSFKISSPMGSVGPKEVDAEDNQAIVLENEGGLVMESSCKTSKVMYSNSFRVCVQHKIVAAGEDACSLRCTLRVNFIKSVMGMIKKQIRAETIKQTHKKYAALHACITEALSGMAAPAGAASPAPEAAHARTNGEATNGEASQPHTASLPPLAPSSATKAPPQSKLDVTGVPLSHRRNHSMTNLKRDTAKSDSKVTGWLLKRSNTLRKWNTRYCEFNFQSGRFEWRKRPDDAEPNGFMTINTHTELQNKVRRNAIKEGAGPGFSINMHFLFSLSLCLFVVPGCHPKRHSPARHGRVWICHLVRKEEILL